MHPEPRQRPRPRGVLGTVARLLVAVSLLASLALVASRPAGRAAAAPRQIDRNAAGPLGPITVIGDSVMLGSLLVSPYLPDRLAEHGWGPIRARAGEGYTVNTARSYVQSWRSQGWDPDAVVVNLGANDADNCGTNVQCQYERIMTLVDAIGPGKRIWWPKITRFPYHRPIQDAWNAALDRIAAERADFFTWDWPTVMYEMGMYYSDHIHQTPNGYRERSVRMAREITATLAVGRAEGGPVPLPSPTAAASEMVPIPAPNRVLDTRKQSPGRLTAGQTVEVDVSGFVPAGATAVAAYVTAAGPSDRGHLGAHPCVANPADTSFTNYAPGQTRGAVTITPLSSEGSFCVYTHAATDLVVDLQAAFVPAGTAGALRFTPLAEPDRLIDTRGTPLVHDIELAIPDATGVEAVAVNLTAVDGGQAGHATAHPCLDTVPDAANLNHLAHETVASAAFVPVSDGGTICIHTHALVDLVVDLTGVFTEDGDLAFRPVTPTRMLDSRKGTGGWLPIHGHGQTVETRVAPAGAAAVSGTITLVAPLRNSHLQAWSCGDRGENSNVNAAGGATLANFVTTGIDAGRLCIFAVNTGQTVFDTTGWWVP